MDPLVHLGERVVKRAPATLDLKKHLEIIVLGIVIITTAPVLIKLFSSKKKKEKVSPPTN